MADKSGDELFDAIASGDDAAALGLIAQGKKRVSQGYGAASLDGCDGRSPLATAIKLDKGRVAAALVDAGASLLCSSSGDGALALALKMDTEASREVAMKMVAKSKAFIGAGWGGKSCLEAEDASGRPALLVAIAAGNAKAGQAMVDAGADLLAGDGSILARALDAGTDAGRAVAMAMIAKSKTYRESGWVAKSCLDAMDASGRSPLAVALEAGDGKAGLALVSAGADMTAAHGYCGTLPKALAIDTEASRTVALAMISKSKSLLDSGWSGASCLDAVDGDGRPALMVALEVGNDGAGVAMVAAGANMAVSHKGCGALAAALLADTEASRAVALAMISKSKTLLACGWHERSCLNATDASGRSALLLAIEQGNEKAGLDLVGAGASLVVEHQGAGALARALRLDTQASRAVALAMIKKSKSLLNSGWRDASCLDAVDEEGCPSLIVAIESGNEQAALALIDAGADLSAAHGKRTPLEAAFEKGTKQARTIAEAMVKRSAKRAAMGYLSNCCKDSLGKPVLALDWVGELEARTLAGKDFAAVVHAGKPRDNQALEAMAALAMRARVEIAGLDKESEAKRRLAMDKEALADSTKRAVQASKLESERGESKNAPYAGRHFFDRDIESAGAPANKKRGPRLGA